MLEKYVSDKRNHHLHLVSRYGYGFYLTNIKAWEIQAFNS